MADDIKIGIQVTGKQTVLGAAKAVKTLEGNVKTLSSAYTKGDLSYKRYNKGIEQLAKETKRSKSELLKFGTAIRANEKAVDLARKAERQAAIETKKYAQARKEATEANIRFNSSQKSSNEAMQQSKRGTNQLGVMMQQTGYQVGDFAVQVQSGTNFMVAFGQQATQLVGTMAMFAKTTKMIALFSGLGIAIPILSGIGAAMLRTSGEGRSLDDTVSDLETSSKNLLASLENLRDDALSETFGNLAGSIERVETAMVSLEAVSARLNLADTLKSLGDATKAGFLSQVAQGGLNLMRIIDPFDLNGSGSGAFGQMTPEDVDEAKFAKLGLGMSVAVFDSYTKSLKDLAKRGDTEGVVSVFADMFEEASGDSEKLTLNGIQLLRTLRSAALASAEMSAEMNGSAEASREAAAAEKARERAASEAAKKTKDLGFAQVKTYQDYQALVKKTKNSQKDQLELVLAINKSGEDSAKVAELRARQEGIAKGLVGEALKKYVATEMVIRGVVIATEEAADAAGKISPALQSAIDQANAFADAMGRAASNSAGIGISTAGINAQIAALEGGSSKAEATAKGAAATLRAELTAALPSFEAGPRSSASIDRQVQERYSTTLERENARAKLSSMTRSGSSGGGGGSKKSPAEELQEYLDKLKNQSKLERGLVGLFGEKRNTEEEVIKARQKYGEVFGESQEAELRGTLALIAADKERQRVFEESEQQRQQLVSSIESTLEDGFMSMIDGTKSVKDAFRDMARDIIRELYRVLVVKKLVASISGFFGFADGGAFSGGSQIQAYADGGVVGGPTFFPMAGGKTGLMGEAGPEAIMPLKRGANGKLGVQADGASQGNVVVNQSFNFQANGDDSVKKLIAQAAPQIANMTQKQIMDSRRRGGSMKAAFG